MDKRKRGPYTQWNMTKAQEKWNHAFCGANVAITEGVMLNQIKSEEKYKYGMISFMCEIQRSQADINKEKHNVWVQTSVLNAILAW